MSPARHSHEKLVLEPVRADSEWHAYRLEIDAFPLETERRRHIRSLVENLTAAIREVLRAGPTLWIDSQPLHHDEGAKLYSANARKWSPEMGFCFDPSGPPPRPLQMSDLMDVDYGTPPRIHDRSAIYLAAHPETMPAYKLLAGRGIATLLYFAGQEDAALSRAVAAFMQHSRYALRPLMAPGQFQSFPFYLPLLSSQWIAGTPPQQLSAWLGDAEVYLRESFETKELLLLSQHDLNPVFQRAQLRPLSISAHDSSWTFSIPSDKDPAHA